VHTVHCSVLLSVPFVHRLLFNVALSFGSRLCFRFQVQEST